LTIRLIARTIPGIRLVRLGASRRWKFVPQSRSGRDGNRLTLIDHGYAFALPRAILNYSDFVTARHRHGAASLLAEEHDALARLLSDSDLLGMARCLGPERAQALADRVQLMLQRGEVLRPGEF
jgi:hypothetical protein